MQDTRHHSFLLSYHSLHPGVLQFNPNFLRCNALLGEKKFSIKSKLGLAKPKEYLSRQDKVVAVKRTIYPYPSAGW